MDEHREEREELAALDRAERDDAREAAADALTGRTQGLSLRSWLRLRRGGGRDD